MDPLNPSSSSSETSDLPPSFLKNPKSRHISRSAAKRESVQLLGSIKDLQLHFSRTGQVEHRPGAGVGVRGLGGIGEGDEDGEGEENRAPYGDLGRGGIKQRESQRERRPWKDVEVRKIDIEEAKKEVRGLVYEIGEIWSLGIPVSPSSATLTITSPTRSTRPVQTDTRTVLVKTAQAIRRARVLSLSISHQAGQSTRRVSTSSLHSGRPSGARSSISTPARPGGLRAVSYGVTEKKSSLGPGNSLREDDVAGRLRGAALEVLAGLRGLEERLRNQAEQSETTTYLHGLRGQSPLGEGSTASSSILDTASTRPTSAAASAIYSDPEEYAFEEDEYTNTLNMLAQAELEEGRTKETWEERIVSEHREYRDLQAEESRVESVRESVRKWMMIVNAMFGGVIGVQEVPAWAKEEDWKTRGLGRSLYMLRVNTGYLANIRDRASTFLPDITSTIGPPTATSIPVIQ